MNDKIIYNQDYKNWSEFILNKIKLAHTNAVFKVNTEMLSLYWEIGNSILEKQKQNGWGSKVVEQLATDLAKNFGSTSFRVESYPNHRGKTRLRF